MNNIPHIQTGKQTLDEYIKDNQPAPVNNTSDQQSGVVQPPSSTTNETQQNSTQPVSWWSVQDAMTVSSITLLFGLFVMAGAVYLMRHCKDPTQILRVLGTILIVIGSIFLIIVGYNQEQITPVIGLLGTIVGYLLGKESNADRNSPEGGSLADAEQTDTKSTSSSTTKQSNRSNPKQA